MPETNKSLIRQVKELSHRLEKIEARIGAGQGRYLAAQASGETQRFCNLPPVPERVFGPEVSPHRARLIRYSDKKWVNGTKLKYYFFKEGSFAGGAEQEDMVREGFAVWEDLRIGISFQEVSDISEAEVRIGFLDGDGAWSYVGRDVIDIPGQSERTMNFGWDLTQDPRGVDTPVHEIGHTLGFPHEHQNPFSGIVWDEAAVYEYFGGPPNHWDRETTLYNVLRKLDASAVEGSDWDPNSIMHYAFPAGLIVQPPEYRDGLRPELGLSPMDIDEVRRFYPPIDDSTNLRLEPFKIEFLSIGPAEQRNFTIEPRATRDYRIQTFGSSDTVMVLFEDQNGELRYAAGDDDSGTSLNAQLEVRLYQGRRYVLRVRLFTNYSSGDTAVMMW